MPEFDNDYLSIDFNYTFNIPQLEICLEMPPESGFTTDTSELTNSCLNIEQTDVYYFFNTPIIDSDENFLELRFSRPHKYKPALYLGIMSLSNGVSVESIIEYFRTSDKFICILPEIESGIGKFTGVQIVHKNKALNIYITRYNKLFYIFLFKQKEKTVRFCHEIIRSLHKQVFGNEIFNYRDEYLNEQNSIGDSGEETELTEFTGKTSQPTVFDLSELGISTTIPADYNYTFFANNLTYVAETNTNQFLLSRKDIKKQGIVCFNFNRNGLFASVILWDVININERIDFDSQTQTVLKRFQLVIGGIPFEAVALGHEENPTINAYGQLDDFGISFSFMFVTSDKIAEVENLIKSIRLPQSQKYDKINLPDKPISQIITIKEKTTQAIPKLEFNKSAYENDSLIRYDFIDIGVSCQLPKGNEFANPEGILKAISPSVRQITGNLTDNTFLSISVTNDDYKSSVSVTVSKLVDQSVDLVTLMDTMSKNWTVYKHIKLLQNGIGTINGIQWGLLQTKQGDNYMSMFTALNNGMSIMFTGTSQRPDIQNYIDMIYKINFETE